MMNYTKSEFYRIFITKEIYTAAGLLAGIALLLNAALYFFGNSYANTSFSYSNLVANPMVFAFMGMIIPFLFYEGGKRNGNLKNTVAGGISRVKIFAGECVVSLAVSTLLMATTMGVWVFSANLLLEKAGPVDWKDFLGEGAAMYLIAGACLISGILFLEIFDKNITGILVWAALWFLLPEAFMYLAVRFPVLYQPAMWLPNNFLAVNASHVNTRECITAWDTMDGVIRCVLSGLAGCIIFGISGAVLLKRRDL